MVVTVDSGGQPINTGSVVTFKVRPSVDSIGGFATPYQIDSSSWTPDPDSTGGESSDSVANNACTISGGNCARTMVGSGTIRIVAHINGIGFESSQHVKINDAHPNVGSNPHDPFYYMTWVDSALITATMSDGSTTTVTGWQWVPLDTGTAHTGSTCTGSKNPCSAAIRESGNMIVTVSYKGKTKHARVKITPKHRFTLTAPTRPWWPLGRSSRSRRT